MAEKLEDLNLPNAVVARLIKEALSEHVLVGKEARVALGRAASVFVLYVTSAATNVAQKANRKIITGQDVLDAMSNLEFESFIEPLKEYQEKFLELKKKKRESLKNKGIETIAEGGEEHEADVDMNEEEDT